MMAMWAAAAVRLRATRRAVSVSDEVELAAVEGDERSREEIQRTTLESVGEPISRDWSA